jgi:hypothetical protein
MQNFYHFVLRVVTVIDAIYIVANRRYDDRRLNDVQYVRIHFRPQSLTLSGRYYQWHLSRQMFQKFAYYKDKSNQLTSTNFFESRIAFVVSKLFAITA